MATIIQKPDTLSLSRNLKELIISTSSEISLQLLKGDSMLLEETYLPDVNNRVHVDLADIVTYTLSLTMPSGDAVSTSQSSVYSDFTVKVDGTSVAEFTAVRSGVERFSDTAANFLTANWLTWQPQVKEVLHDQPEWLTYYPASGSCACYARFYYTDGTSGEKKVCDVSQCVSINTRFSKLWALDESGKERYGVIDVYIKDAQGLRLTYVQRYVLCSQGALDEVYLCENSLGGLDTFRFSGDRKLVPEIGYTSLLLDNSYTAADPDLSRKWSQNTGMLTGRECEWCWELFRSSAAYHLYRGTILPIVLDASSVEKSAMSVLAAYSFDYRYASDLGLLNVVRSENLPEVVEVSGPDAEVFFLTPRLNEFPSAVLSDDLIIPVQAPYEESWYTLSVGGLKSALLSSVETIYGPMWHVHDNLQVLNLLSVDEKGNLLYNGLAVGSGIVGAHDHYGETIRPEKIIVGDVEITCVDGRLHISKGLVSDGDIAAFGAEEGEEGGSGGLDIARLWEELEADDSSKVIDVSHIPGSVVLQDELTEILDDYPLTTEMNTALGGKADKGWVEEELAKYLLLTGGKISGDLEVTGTLKIGDAVLSYADGRLHVSSSVTSDGDFVAFGDEEGSTGSGGLDVARMWEELEAPGTKQIDVSHIPDIELSKISDLHASWDSVLAGQKPAWLTAVSLSTISDLHASWDDMLKAKKPTTLAGYGIADAYTKTEIDGELEKYVTIAGNQDITGVKTFVNGIKIGSISLSVVDGRLRVSSTITSDGDFVAYGDDEGGEAGGGLDVARLWEELKAEDASKVIDVSHIPGSVVLQDELTEILDDYPLITEMNTALAGKASLQHSHAITDITSLQAALSSKWVWNASQIAGVKVNNAVAADKLATARKINGTSFSGELDIVTDKWGNARTVTIWDYCSANKQATQGVDGSVNVNLLLPQSIKVKTLDVDGVTLSVVDGRLHISATATSAGDFVAYGDETGSSGSGGLDISRLWDELRADDSSKVIDITHIPSIPVDKVTGLSGAVSTITKANLTASRALVSNASGKVAVSAVTATELGYLDGVTSNIQSQLNGKQAAGSYVTTNTAQDVTGLKTFARDAASVLYVENTAATSTSKYSAIVFQRAGSNIGIIAAGVDTNYLYRANPAFSTVYTILDAGNYTSYTYPTTVAKISDLHSSWDSILTTSGVRSRSMTFNGTNYPCYTAAANTSDITWYAPTTAGTSGYVLQSTGGTPAWAAQNSLVVKGIYERSLGVAAGDTMADLKSALTTQMGSGLNKPGSMGFVTATSVANIMSNWANDDYELVAGARTNFLRLDGYGSSIYGVFLVSGYQGGFYRLLKNSSTAWAGPYLILDTGNYASTLDSRYVNISGDTMTGRLTLGDSSRLDLVVGGTTRTAVYDDGDYTIFGDPNHKACIRGSRIIFQNATGSNGLVMEGDTFTFKGNSIWHAGNDGPGSGLNADLLDGYQASSFLLKSGGTMTGTLTVPSLYVNTLAYIYESASHATRLTFNWSGGIARIYAINNSGSGYYDMSLGQTPGNSGALYFDASAASWGIGTTSPAYKLDVAGTLRATDIVASGKLFVPSSEGYQKYYIRFE